MVVLYKKFKFILISLFWNGMGCLTICIQGLFSNLHLIVFVWGFAILGALITITLLTYRFLV
jgi:hypothetical protein